MSLKLVLWSGLGGIALAVAGFAIWLLSLPPTPMAPAPAPVGRQEAEAMRAALTPPKRERPLIAIIGINDATETTDYLVP